MGNELFCKTCKRFITEEIYVETQGFCKRCKVIITDEKLKQKKTLLNFNKSKSKK